MAEGRSESRVKQIIEPVRITGGGRHYFFGYYDKQQWCPENRFMLGMATGFCDRPPEPGDRAQVVMFDSARNFEMQHLSSTCAWCWQQGSMLQWLPGRESAVIHNERIGDRFVSVLLDVRTKERRILPRPVYTVSNDGKKALSLNFSRVAFTRPGYGYYGLEDRWRHEKAPAEDGIYLMDLDTGDHRLILSLEEIAGTGGHGVDPGAVHWVNHLLLNPAGDRFIFLHRWRNAGGFTTRLCTANADGSDVFVSSILNGSHFIWYDCRRLLIWARTEEHGDAYYLVEDGTDGKEIVGGEILDKNGHCSFSPDRRWLLTDEYPGEQHTRPLILYDMHSGRRVDIGEFYSPPELAGELRCDLHPRWDRKGEQVCIDSAHEGQRSMYLLDVSEVLK